MSLLPPPLVFLPLASTLSIFVSAFLVVVIVIVSRQKSGHTRPKMVGMVHMDIEALSLLEP